MMNTKTFAFLLAFSLTTANAPAQLIKSIEGNGNYVTISKKVDHFTEVNVGANCDVVYVQGEDKARIIWIEAESNIIDMVHVESKRSVIKISLDAAINVTKFGHIRVTIGSEELYKVKNSGTGTFTSKGKVVSPHLELSVSGNGKIEMDDLDAKKLSANISSEDGTIVLRGKAKEARYKIQFGGEINADALEAESVKNVIFAGGVIGCHATKFLKNTFWGSGKVYYRGQPEIAPGGNIGTGKIIPLK